MKRKTKTAEQIKVDLEKRIKRLQPQVTEYHKLAQASDRLKSIK